MINKHDSEFLVGPVFRPGELASIAVEAIETDNPNRDLKVEDRVGYIRVETEKECIINRETIEQILGRSFQMSELETILSSFSGRIEVTEEFMRFYLG